MTNTFEKEYEKIKKEYYDNKYQLELNEIKEKLMNNTNILFGVGFFSQVIIKSLKEHSIKIECFCDNNKTGIEENSNLQIISVDELRNNHLNSNIIISVTNPKAEKQIFNQLNSLGFSNDKIFNFETAYKFFKKSVVEIVHLELNEFEKYLDGYEWAYDFFEDNRSKEIIIQKIRNYLFNETFPYYLSDEYSYFPDEIKLSEREIFIDAGFYTGDTTKVFINKTSGNYKKIIGFDIDYNNIKIAEEELKNNDNIEIYNKGLWNSSGKFSAELGKKAGSSIKKNGNSIVDLITLDEIFDKRELDDYPTYIKFNIEGSEQEALLGSKNIIKKVNPRLAICVYHKPEDIYVIPQMLHKLNPNYRFKLKHYSPYTWDTVCYAF